MIIPKDFLENNSIGFAISYQKDGHIDDSDADKLTQPTELLNQLQEQQKETNKLLEMNGQSGWDISGWGIPPHYNPTKKQLIWGMIQKMHDTTISDGLNYQVRILGRA